MAGKIRESTLFLCSKIFVMKNCFTFFTLLLGISVFAQSKMFVHTATSDNSSGVATMLDHPDLNGNPNATFVFSHFYGIYGEPTENNIDKNLGVWYDGSNWAIYTEDQSPMPEGLAFDILIAANVMSTNEVIIADKINVYPNPVKDILNINSEKPIQKIQVMNMAGQIVHERGEDSSINMQNLPKGLYIVHIYTPNQMQSKKVIKE